YHRGRAFSLSAPTLWNSIPQAMNISNETSNYLIYPVKTSIYLIDLVCSSTCSYMITRTVQENVILKEDFKYFLLCQYLICTSLYFTLGTLTNSFHLFHINSPRVICWILFAVQITFAQSIMLTLTLLAFNTCIAIYWPLSYKSFVSLAKRKIIAIFWVLSMFNPFWLSIYESWGISLSYVTAKDDTCPNAMDGTVSRIAGMVFILLCFLLIVFSYGLIYREGKRAGHFNSSNCRARKTILIIGVQLSLFIVPVLITLALAKEDHTTFYLLNVISYGSKTLTVLPTHSAHLPSADHKPGILLGIYCFSTQIERSTFILFM
uniref:G-protein coupled receptors family 1 profile domain-containing protein n=1 Tax=Callorhinchus milii TaxID=7868 RepID=A0A4W3HID9_CALMI